MEEEEYIPRFLPETYTHIDARYSVELDFARYRFRVENNQLIRGETKDMGPYYEVERLSGGHAVRRLYLEVMLENKNKLFIFNSEGEMLSLKEDAFGVIWDYGPVLYTDGRTFKEARRRKNKSEGFSEEDC